MSYPPQPPGYGPPPGAGQGPGHQQGPDWASPPAPPGPVEMPATIRNAVLLMWVGAGLSAVNGLSVFLLQDQVREQVDEQVRRQGDSGVDPDALVTFALVAGALGAGIGLTLWAVHAIAVGKGQAWARITGSVLYGISLLGFLIGLAQPNPALSRVLSVLSLLVGTGATVLMWMNPSSRYVEDVRRSKRGW